MKIVARGDMKPLEYLDIQLNTPEEQLACDEVLLELAEEGEHPGFLRFFESPVYFVVLGYGKKLAEEVFEEACRGRAIPILRRCSGGGTVLQGPGCVNYTLVLPVEAVPDLETITGANRFIMGRQRDCLAALLQQEVQVEGITDLTLGGKKFSGNAQRRKKRCLLFHGSFLLNFDLALISEVLRSPGQQPEYRQLREHQEFLTNVPLRREALEAALLKAWNGRRAQHPIGLLPMVDARVKEKYSQHEWNRRF